MMEQLTETHRLTKDKTLVIATSKVLAEVYDKRHGNVLRDIEELIEKLKSHPPKLRSEMFIESTYSSRGKEYKQYLITRDGFTLLAMGFTGAKALEFKLKYIDAFNNMEQELYKYQVARLEAKSSFKKVTDALKGAYGDNIKGYQYSTESNMLNNIVLGMSSKKFKEVNNIEGDIRGHLKVSQLEALEELEDYDSKLIKAGYDYASRKTKCEEYYRLTSE